MQSALSQKAQELDHQDPLSAYRSQFHFPKAPNGSDAIYLCSNSLGLQPKTTKKQINEVLDDWGSLGVKGHFQAKHDWVSYHENLTKATANIVGAKNHEVVVMNTLTVNLHLMMISFYRPRGNRNKIIIESGAFPSDIYAVTSQIRFHGLDPDECLIQLKPRAGESILRSEDIKSQIDKYGSQTALIMFGNTNYLTGQYFDMKQITQWGHEHGCMVGFDCAHGAGNQDLQLHDTGCDFAVWCNYKYLCSGPGSLAGAFVHERHADDHDIPRLEGWWGTKKETRFLMKDKFEPMYGVEAWQLSCPTVLSMASIWASLRIYDEVGIKALRQKSILLTGYLEELMDEIQGDTVTVITPRDPAQRGCQLSIQVKHADKSLFYALSEKGIISDWREPNIIRIAPSPMYNSFDDVFRFAETLKSCLS